MVNLMAAFGWTWEYVEMFDLPRYYEISSYWEKHPPLHLLVAGYFGYNGESNRKADDAGNDQSLNDLVAALGGTVSIKHTRKPAK
jgi:hypothetical protein